MRVPGIAAFGIGAVLGVMGACTSFGATSDADAGASGREGGADAGGGELDAAPDAGSGCTMLVDDDFATQRPDWTLTPNGNAKFETRRLVLTDAVPSQIGAAWWNHKLTYDGYLRVRVDFETTTPGGSDAGNGLAVAWVDEPEVPKVFGGLGEAFELCKSTPVIHGYAVTASTQRGRIAILDTVDCNAEPVSNRPDAGLEGAHSFGFQIRPSSIKGSFDTMPILSRTNLAPPAATSGFFGVTAGSTVDVSTSHVITRVRVESCPN